MSVSAMEIAA